MKFRNPIILLLLLLSFLPGSALLNDPQITQVDANTVRVRIDQPTVTQRSTAYPTVKFQPGDQVTVTAGGCVQTGGSGSTWKRYVNPSGDNSDRLYHGRIQIPTATQGLETIQGVIARSPVHVGNPAHASDLANFYLTLGYDDDQYDDNGYYSHDDGTENQCQNVGNAWVELTIVHAPVAQPAGPKAPMDLWWEYTDDNLVPLNPAWGMQVDMSDPANPKLNGKVPDPGALCNNFHDEDDSLKLGNPSCTTQTPTVDEPNGWSDPVFWAVCQSSGGVSGAVHGHINWGLATYTGSLNFTDHSVPFPSGTGDDDYDMELVRPDQASATVNNGTAGAVRTLGLEFDSDETIDAFDTPWWKDFHSAVDADSSWAKARGMLDGADAIVTGLIGIDNKHNAHAELHPVLGLMARVPNRSTTNSDFWVFFARPMGDEGGCSQDLHQFVPGNNMQFLLPLAAAEHATIASSNVRSTSNGASWTATQFDDGLSISITFPSVVLTSSTVVYGEFTINHDSSQFHANSVYGPLRNMTRSIAPSLTHPAGTQANSNQRMVLGNEARAVNIKTFESEKDSYLEPLTAEMTKDEWNKVVTAYQNPAVPSSATKPPVAVAKPATGTKGVVARPQAMAVENPAIKKLAMTRPTFVVARSKVPALRRHRVLGKTEPRNLVRSTFALNRSEILLHQRFATALKTAVGPVRAKTLLQTADQPKSTAPRTMQLPW